METLLVLLYFSVLLLLCAYGLHRAHLVLMVLRHRKQLAAAERTLTVARERLPSVTVQLPLYNEATVVARLLEAAGRIDYPSDRLEIQVLDDSNDETVGIAQAKVEELRRRGVNAVYVRRPDRVGYKAGALDYGLGIAQGELIAIFDADFVPQPSFLLDVVGHFEDPVIGMVQTRWGHMNRDATLLTSVQALMLDGHHLVENRARFGAGCMFNFSGTGGIWRRAAIDAAGGWQHDTLTEDLDLSYRAQLAGWRFVYRPDVVTPAELPEDMSAFRAQQYRWAKGTVQTARKLLGRVLGAELRLSQRIEAFFHLTPHFAYPLMMLLSVLLLPALLLMPATNVRSMLLIDVPLCLGATGSLASFYMLAERAQGRSVWSAAKRLPALIALGAGLAPHLSKAVWQGLGSMAGEFVRTPKRGITAGRYRQAADLPLIELALTLLSAASVVAAVTTGHWLATPFAALFMCGYGYVAGLVLSEQASRRRAVVRAAPEPSLAAAELAELSATDIARAA
ncbi:MAG: glycosyltransferase [Sorangiineae bacterium]|nr:glycosyltransferase [Polyangiaceae bacterium]MEB2323369.1 glycosyltransferase [Sorangiineae bacterium]